MDTTCSSRETDNVESVLRSHMDTLVKAPLYRLDVAMLRLRRGVLRLSTSIIVFGRKVKDLPD